MEAIKTINERIDELWEEHLKVVKEQGYYSNTLAKREVKRVLLRLSHILGAKSVLRRIEELRKRARAMCINCPQREGCAERQKFGGY